MNRALLRRLLAQLPGGGVVHNSILDIDDQEQCFKAQLIVKHRVSDVGYVKKMDLLLLAADTPLLCLDFSMQQEDWNSDQHPEGFVLSGGLPTAQAEQLSAEAPADVGGRRDGRNDRRGPMPAHAGASELAALQETEDDVVLLASDDEEDATEAAVCTGGSIFWILFK